MIKAPIEDGEAIISERFPCPELIKTFVGDGKERWLKCHLNPCPAEGDIDTVEVYHTTHTRQPLAKPLSYSSRRGISSPMMLH